MNRYKIPVINDYIFKKIFTKKGNEDVLKDFLIAVLDLPIEKVKAKSEVSLEKDIEENKLGRLDIIATLNDDTIVNIEIQVLNNYDFIERTLYYWSGIYYNELKKGEEYIYTKKVITINILNYNLFEEGKYHEIVKLKREYENKVLTDKLEIHFIQIPKYKKQRPHERGKLEQWLEFISQIDKKGVELAMEENKEIRKANEDYEYLTGEEAERRLAFLREKAIKDEKSGINGARREGEKIGEKKSQIKIAKNLLRKGLAVEEIIEITELTKEEINNIK